jgi:hypothetical protein
MSDSAEKTILGKIMEFLTRTMMMISDIKLLNIKIKDNDNPVYIEILLESMLKYANIISNVTDDMKQWVRKWP